MFQVTNTDTARVLTMIETACPNALSKKISTDEVLINLDALTPRCFHEVNAFVLACFLNISGSKKNKKRKIEGTGSGGVGGTASSSNAAGSSTEDDANANNVAAGGTSAEVGGGSSNNVNNGSSSANNDDGAGEEAEYE